MPRGEHNAMKTECPEGHPLSGDNLRISKRATGDRRVCRRCAAESTRKRYAERKAADG